MTERTVSQENDQAVVATLRRRIDQSPMRATQWSSVFVAFGVSVVDGYDVLSATFVVPVLQKQWGLEAWALGFILASGLVGMALGSFFIAPFADRYGRRPLIMFGLLLSALGMLLTARSQSFEEIMLYRLGTGLGVGTIMAAMSSVAAEVTNLRWRPFAIALIVIGFPVGGMVAGLNATLLFPEFGWQVEFWVGAALTGAMIPVVFAFMPESLESLLASKSRRRSALINAMLQRLGHKPLDRIPQLITSQRSYPAIFAPGQRMATLWITTLQLLLMQCVLFVLSWLPQIVANAEIGVKTANLTGTVTNAAGIFGGFVFGLMTGITNLRHATLAAVLGLACMTVAIGLAPAIPTIFLIIGALAGIFVYSAQAGFYTILPSCFAPEVRATGIGFVLGVVRIGGAASPLIAGWLFAAGLDRLAVCLVFASIAVAAALLLQLNPR